jgi:spermidine/putrescine transport system permease protein
LTARAGTGEHHPNTREGQAMRRRSLLGLAASLPFIRTAAAQGTDYPSRPVRVLVGFPPGGGVDLTARPLLAKVQERLGSQFVVENRGGANGNIAMEAAARAAPDGYTLFFGNGGNLAINHALYANLSFDTLRDFAPIAQVVQVPLAVTVPADLPVRNVQEFIALARSRPGQLNMGSGGTGGLPHLAFELFRRQANIDVVHVPYRGSAPALQDRIGGRVQIMIDAFNLSRGAVEAGRVRVIATTGRERMPALPDVPTVAEQGLPDFVAIGWQDLGENPTLAPSVLTMPLGDVEEFDPVYAGILLRSLRLAALTVVVCLCLCYPAAFWVSRLSGARKNLVLFLVTLPFFANLIIRVYAWMLVLRPTGVLTRAFDAVGLGAHAPDLMFTEGAVVIGLAYVLLPFMFLPLYASIEKLDPALSQASSDLGASPLQGFLRVTLPLTTPGILGGSVLVFIPAFGNFVVPALMGGAKVMLVGNTIEQQFLAARNWPFGAALAMLVLGIILVAMLAYAWRFGRGDAVARP